MSKRDLVHLLRGQTETLRGQFSEICSVLAELTQHVSAEEFFPERLAETVLEKFPETVALQAEVKKQFSALGMGDVPLKLEETAALLGEYENRLLESEKYIAAVRFFLSLRSEDPEIQNLLEQRKKVLRAYDFEKMDGDAVKETAECYVWLSDAFYEKDPVRKFSLVYRLAGCFEEAIARGIQFGIITVEEETSEEQQEVSVSVTEKDEEDVWRLIGIIDPTEIISEEEPGMLDVEVSQKAAGKFGVKEFKRDLAKQVPVDKVTCLLHAYAGYGFSMESISLWSGPGQPYELAAEKLTQQGYLKKYVVKGFGEFYTLSRKGLKAFETKESAAFLARMLGESRLDHVKADPIEDRADSAAARFLCCTSYKQTMKINPDYVFYTRSCYVGSDFFFYSFPDVLCGKTVEYLGIVSENPEQFRMFYERLLEEKSNEKQYVVLALTHEKAEKLAGWVRTILGQQISVWYCGYTDDTFYDSEDQAVVNLEDYRQEDEQEDKRQQQDEKQQKSEKRQEDEEQRENEKQQEGERQQEDGKQQECGKRRERENGQENERQQEVEQRQENERQQENEKQQNDEKKQEDEEQRQNGKQKKDGNQAEGSEPSGEALDGVLSGVTDTKLLEDAAKIEDAEGDLDPENAEEKTGSEQPEAEENPENYEEEYQRMLAAGKLYAAAAYVRVLADRLPSYESVYHQLAYAVNDPMDNCSYNSDTIFRVFYYEESPVSDYFVVSAAIRNYFYDQFSYDYSLKQLQDLVSGNRVLREISAVDGIVYTLQQFKTEHHRGMDRYADYREKARASWEKRLEEIRREAKGYYENYSIANIKENASHKRFIETGKLLLGPHSELSEYLQVVINDDREMLELLEEFLAQNYVKDQAAICEENIEPSKIDHVLDSYWDLAAKNIRLVKKTSDLMSSLRMNLFKRVRKVVVVLCNYVFLLKSAVPSDDDPAFNDYRKIRSGLLGEIDTALCSLAQMSGAERSECAGQAVLQATLEELKERLEGSYQENSSRFFYIDFLRNSHVLLDEEFFPVLDEIPELPELSVRRRILRHCQEPEKEWKDRLKEIFSGEDDYGSAERILEYLNAKKIPMESEEEQLFSVDRAIVFSRNDMENKRQEFIEDLELAQSYGQIDNTVENVKEMMIQVMENWYAWAVEMKNYGFFARILEAFREKIHRDAEARAAELNRSLSIYVKGNPQWKKEEQVAAAVEQIRKRIEEQNYAAAEDLLNRLLTNDLVFDWDPYQTDYLQEFLDEYDINYRRTANPGTTLKALVYTSKINKDTKGADKLLDSWPRGARVGEAKLRALLEALGFVSDTIRMEAPLQGKIESYLITLRRPQNGRKSNYKHPIAAFGSEAEEKGFRVVCLFGKTDASRLIDTFKEIGNAKNTIVLLDYALTLADRRTLARKTKTDLTGKIFAVIDRVVLIYLAKHYTETAVNRMLMAVIMPFASCQPYIEKSADVMPQEMFIGRKNELEKIESATGVNIVYGGRQLGKTALLRMAKKDIDMDENGDRAVIVNAWRKDYRDTARAISAALYDEGILKTENITEDWDELARDIKNRLRDQEDPIPYLLLMIDEADEFIESCELIGYQPFDALKDIQSVGNGRFKFVVAGLRNIVRFKRAAALGNNSVLTHLDSLTVKPFRSMEARELLEEPLYYLGFRFPKDNETEILISTIFGTTNYFPGLIQLYCAKLIEAMKRDYAGYFESETPPYYVRKEHIKKILAEQSLQQDIREKFFVTLKVGDDDYYYIIALLAAYYYHENKSQSGCNAEELSALADTFSIRKLTSLDTEKITALMEEMQELGVLQHTGDGRYRFTRHSFCQMMGTVQQIEDELLVYMED